MRYVLLSILILLLCLFSGVILTKLLLRKRPLRMWQRILLSCGTPPVLLALCLAILLLDYYRSEPSVREFLRSTERVRVESIREGYFFDGPGDGSALVFYPGARVEESAYAPLLFRLADAGLDCFLAKMPAHMAVFAPDIAEQIIAEHPRERWYLMGHSLGGVLAASYAADHGGIDGLILLASYPTKELPEGLRLLCLYGSEDGCMTRSAYESSKAYWPEDAAEAVIDGGNHAQFGNYGAQLGDGAARISAQEQQDATLEAVMAWADP